MIVIGAYPDSFEEIHGSSRLGRLGDFVEKHFHEAIGLHVLPFFPHCGDGGFAVESWLHVRDDLGTWADIQELAVARFLMVDGVYNHVGITHPLVQAFFSDPDSNHGYFFAFKTDEPLRSPRSPRGGPMLREFFIRGERWLLWQTFSEVAVDIRLDHPEIQAMIRAQADLLRSTGVSAVRIDAPAYFGKGPDGPPRHHPDSYRLARLVAGIIQAGGLRITAQLDSDAPALAYFPPTEGYNVPVVDFSFAAHLALAVLGQDPSHLAIHLQHTWSTAHTLLRGPRTHDGILMKSTRFSDEARTMLVNCARRSGIEPRVIEEFDYELNCSLPFLHSQGADDLKRQRALLCVALSGFIPGWCYLYLPFLVGFEPELLGLTFSDPRELNRQTITEEAVEEFQASAYSRSLRDLMCFLVEARTSQECPQARERDVVRTQGSLLIAPRSDYEVTLAVNFSTSEVVDVSELGNSMLFGSGINEGKLHPLGFGFWKSRSLAAAA